MPIKLPNGLPALKILEREGVRTVLEIEPTRRDVRPLWIALLNLMPDKIRTETQIARLVGSTPLPVEMTLLRSASHKSRNTPEPHLNAYYQTRDQVRHERFDGLIVRGAPVETMPFEEVDYWPELTGIFDWALENVFNSFYICWSAQAALYHFRGVPKHRLPQKMSGVFRYRIARKNTGLLQGFDDEFPVPVSRYTEVRREDVPQKPGLDVLVVSPESGLCLIQDVPHRAIYMFNHLEYDAETLKYEYERDVAAGEDAKLPAHYFPDDDPTRPPANQWRSSAQLLFRNWINEMYEHTLHDVSRIGV